MPCIYILENEISLANDAFAPEILPEKKRQSALFLARNMI